MMNGKHRCEVCGKMVKRGKRYCQGCKELFAEIRKVKETS